MMSEAVGVVTDFWFEALQKPWLRVIATDERDYVCGRLPMEVWEITREEWLARETLRRRHEQ